MTPREGRGHYAHWASLESNWILRLLAGKNVYDVVQQTNKPLVAGIARGGWLEDASRLKSSCSSLLPSRIKHLCAEGRPGVFDGLVVHSSLSWGCGQPDPFFTHRELFLSPGRGGFAWCW